jgi:hypothetical protein
VYQQLQLVQTSDGHLWVYLTVFGNHSFKKVKFIRNTGEFWWSVLETSLPVFIRSDKESELIITIGGQN